MVFTAAELEYLTSQRLGRLATIQPAGSIQNNPIVYWYNAEADAIDIGGRTLGTTQKFKNVAANARASLVIDDVVSQRPWRARGIEIRGRAEALVDQPLPPGREFLSPELIRIHPEMLFTWGLDPTRLALVRRDVTSAAVRDRM